MACTPIVVTHRFANPDGTPASGVIAFRLSGRMTNGTETIASGVPVHATLDAGGNLSQTLPATDDAATSPQGTTYTVELFLNGADGTTFSGVAIPSASPGGTVDLGSLLPTAAGG